jgi:hypothetical protein
MVLLSPKTSSLPTSLYFRIKSLHKNHISSFHIASLHITMDGRTNTEKGDWTDFEYAYGNKCLSKLKINKKKKAF